MSLPRPPWHGLAWGLLACSGLALAAPAEAPAAIPYAGEGPGLAALGLRLGLALVLVAGAGALLLALLRRWRGLRVPGAAARRLDILETRRLDAKASLILLRWGGRELLLARSERGVAVLATGAEPPAAAP